MIARAAVLLIVLAAAAPPPPAPATLAARIDATSARAVVDDLDNKNQLDAVLDRIGKGSSAWVALAPRLAPGTDAASAEGLGIALAQALPLNATAVLRASTTDDGAVGIRRVCSVPFIETSPAYNAAYARRTLAALSRFHDATLAAKRDQCSAALTAP